MKMNLLLLLSPVPHCLPYAYKRERDYYNVTRQWGPFKATNSIQKHVAHENKTYPPTDFFMKNVRLI